MKHRLLIADDHAVARAGLRDIVARTADLEVVAEASDGVQAEALARSAGAELLLLDIALPARRGIEVLQALRDDGITLPVLFFSMVPAEQYVDHLRRARAQGFVGKEADAQALLRAIRRVLAGGTSFPSPPRRVPGRHRNQAALPLLSRREAEVLAGIVAGHSLREIGAALGIGAPTVTTYRRRVLDKFGVASNAELVALAMRSGTR